MSRKHRVPTRHGAKPDGIEGLKNVARLQVESGRTKGHVPSRIRSDIRAALREALEPSADFMAGDELPDGDTVALISPAGMFRFVLDQFGLDRSLVASQARWYAVVEAAVNEAFQAKRIKREAS